MTSTPDAPAAVTLADVEAARERIGTRVRRTPMLRKEALSQVHGVPVYLKGEHLQRTGSFKLRGALNLLLQMSPEERSRGVVAASAGNHAQGVAVAAAELGVHATIFMPEDATLSKVEATANYGAEVRLEGASLADSLLAAQAWAESHGASFVHPFNDLRVIAGQGTLGMEIVEDVPDIATLIVPVGGGGLFAGIGTAVRALRPECRIIAVQASASASLRAAAAVGHPVATEPGPTMADGIAVKQPGSLTYGLVREAMDDCVLVDDDEIARAMLWLVERGKQIVEGAGAASLAALMSGKVEPTGPTVCLLSGGNIDPMQLIPVLRTGLTAAGRFMTCCMTVPDRPGELSRLTRLLADLKVNVLSIEHHREGVRLRVSEARVDLTLQTRNTEHVDAVLAALVDAGYAVSQS